MPKAAKEQKNDPTERENQQNVGAALESALIKNDKYYTTALIHLYLTKWTTFC